MIALKRILVATDFSEHAAVALRYGVELAKAFDSEILLCHIVEPSSAFAHLPPMSEHSFSEPNTDGLASQARETGESQLQEAGVANGRVLVEIDHAIPGIIRMARNEDVDLIVAGTHGRGAIAHMLLGSVAERVVQKAPCPVLVVREGEHDFVMP